MDADRGDPQNGWDANIAARTRSKTWWSAIYEILRAGGIAPGSNFDAKLRRQSVDQRTDLVPRHIGGLDTLARALLIATEACIESEELAERKDDRYSGWGGELGTAILGGTFSLATWTTPKAQHRRVRALRAARRRWRTS